MAKAVIKAGDPTKALVRAIAMDIGKQVVHHIETMYPNAIKACSSTFKLSVRNCVHNEIMAALEVTDEGKIIGRIHAHKEHRRKIKALGKVKSIEELRELMRHHPGDGE